MSATDELRAMLDERGVEWKDYGYENHTWWSGGENVGWHAENRPSVRGLYVKIEAVLTPAQAIAATLGAETCEADETDLIPFVRADSGDCDVDYIHVMECSACGGTYEHVNGSYEFCPQCGRRVVGE